VTVVRWINLGLAIVLGALLVMELTRAVRTEPPVPSFSEAPPKVAQERPGRRSRRMEARLAIEDARRQQRARSRGPAGPVLLGEDGQPISD
jgi:hypothetical protein